MIAVATQVMMGEKLDLNDSRLPTLDNPHDPEDYVGIKVRNFLFDSFSKII